MSHYEAQRGTNLVKLSLLLSLKVDMLDPAEILNSSTTRYLYCRSSGEFSVPVNFLVLDRDKD